MLTSELEGKTTIPAVGGTSMGSGMNLIRGTLDALILRALVAGPRHGYEIVEWISRITESTLQIDDGALYTSLHRMESREWLTATWGISPKGRKARYYRLTSKGRRRLEREAKDWFRYADAVRRVFEAPDEDLAR